MSKVETDGVAVVTSLLPDGPATAGTCGYMRSNDLSEGSDEG